MISVGEVYDGVDDGIGSKSRSNPSQKDVRSHDVGVEVIVVLSTRRAVIFERGPCPFSRFRGIRKVQVHADYLYRALASRCLPPQNSARHRPASPRFPADHACTNPRHHGAVPRLDAARGRRGWQVLHTRWLRVPTDGRRFM